MDRKEVVSELITLLREYQENIGEDVEEFNEKTRPIGDLSNFDSLTGVTATVHCYEKFAIKGYVKGISIFVGENRRGYPRALSVGEIADRILTLIS